MANDSKNNDCFLQDLHSPVDIIASGYEWICPVCDEHNKVIEYTELVTCRNHKCQLSFKTNPPEHATG